MCFISALYWEIMLVLEEKMKNWEEKKQKHHHFHASISHFLWEIFYQIDFCWIPIEPKLKAAKSRSYSSPIWILLKVPLLLKRPVADRYHHVPSEQLWRNKSIEDKAKTWRQSLPDWEDSILPIASAPNQMRRSKNIFLAIRNFFIFLCALCEI